MLLRTLCGLFGVGGFLVSVMGLLSLGSTPVPAAMTFCAGGSLFCLAAIVEVLISRK